MSRRRRPSQSPPEEQADLPETTGILLRVLADPSGDCPFDDWIYGLQDRQAQARIVTRLLRVQRGNFGDHRERISGAVCELRIDYGPGCRVYYARRGDVLVVLLGGGTKQGQQRDIEAAKALWERNESDVERLSREYGAPAE